MDFEASQQQWIYCIWEEWELFYGQKQSTSNEKFLQQKWNLEGRRMGNSQCIVLKY